MSIPIQTHLTTTNVYVQREIVRKNIQFINSRTSHPDFSKLVYQHRRDILKLKDKQVNILSDLNKKVKLLEQQTFNFGGYLSTN